MIEAPQEASSQALAEAARSGDRGALEALLGRYEGPLYRFANRMCRDREDARDVLQESLLAAARSIGSYRGEGAPTSWLYAIARSFCIKKHRTLAAQAQRVPLEHADLPSPGDEPETAAARAELLAALDDAIAGLTPEHREVLLLRDVEGLTASEVADALALSVPQVKSRLHRARTSLRKHFDPKFAAAVHGEQAPGCPDILTTFSQYLEGEIDAALCAKMEDHIDLCSYCRTTCGGLKEVLRVCSAVPTPQVPTTVQTAVRHAIAKLG